MAWSFRMSLSRAVAAAPSVVRSFSSSASRGGPNAPTSAAFFAKTSVRLTRTDFFGSLKRLECTTSTVPTTWVSNRFLSARAKIKRRKDSAFDNVVQKEKKVRIVSKIKGILVKQPGRMMTLLQLGKHRREFGLTGKRRVVSLLNKYPAVFEVYEDTGNVMYVRFTEEAEAQYLEELKLKEELEGWHVEKLRKLLMMSVDKRLNITKIAHIKNDLGLSEDFRTSLIPKYPQYFKMVDTDTGPALELTFWDPLLGISAAQKKAAAEAAKGEERPRIIIDGEEIVSTALSNKRLQLPKGVNLTKKDRTAALKFQQQSYVSPYSDATGLDPASLEAEKRACATVHELLSLTVQKKTLVDHLTHFKRDYKFSQRIRAMLIRHPEMFYVSFKGHRDSVFLREAYEGSELIEKDPLFLAKERLTELVHTRAPRERAITSDRKSEDERGEDGEGDDSDGDLDFISDTDIDEEFEEEDGDEESEDDELTDGEKPRVAAEGPARNYAPSPRRKVLSYKDLKPRPTDVHKDRQQQVVTMDKPREIW